MSETKRKTSVMRRAWQWLTEPSPRLTDPALRERSRLLSALLLLLAAGFLIGAAYVDARFSPGPAQTNPEFLMILGIAAGALVAYFLNRRGAYLSAALLAAGLLAAGTFGATHFTLSGALAPTYGPDGVDLLVYLVLPLFFAAVLLPVRLAAVAGGCIVAGMLLIPVVHPHVPYSSIVFGPSLFLLVTFAFILFIARYWQGVARSRRVALTERGERFRNLFEESLDPIFLVAADGTIAGVNAAGSELFGYPRAELEGRHMRDLYLDPARHAEVVLKAERQGQHYEEPVRLKKRDGSVLDCLVTTRLRRDGEGGVLEYQTIVRDVTDRLRAEEDLRLRGELIALAQDSVYLIEPAGEIVFANEALGGLMGYGVEELVGMNIRRLNTPEGAESVPSRIGRVLREGELEFETVYVRKDGSRLDMEVRTRMIRTGGRTLLLSVGRDVTQRKSDESELRLRGELLDSVRDSVFLHDLRGNFLYVNEAAVATLGYTRDELLSLKARQVSASEHFELFRRRIDVLLRKGSTTFESEHVRKDGSVLPVEVRASLVESGDQTLVLSVARDITERKRAQQTLKDSEEKYRLLFEQSTDAIYIGAPDGTAIDVNQAWLDLFGYSREDLPRISAIDLYANPADREHFVRRMAETGFVKDEVLYKRKDETVFLCQRFQVARRDTSGAVVAYQGINRDVTEGKRAQEELRNSEERYRILFEQSMDAIYINAPDGSSVEANQAWLDLFGYSRDELPGFNAVEVYANPEDREDFLRRMAAAGFVDDEVRFKKKDGTVFNCQRRFVAQRDEHGSTRAFQGVMRDVTEMRNAERALRKSEEKFRMLFEQSMDAIFVTAFDGSHVEANQAALDLLGYSRDELPGLNAVDFYANPEDREDFLRRIEETGLVEDEVRFKKKDGTVMDCQRTTVARKDDEGNVVACQGIMHDITNRKLAQQVLTDSEEKYRTLFEQSMDAIYINAPGGASIDANQAWLDLFGYSRDELPGFNAVEVYANPEEREDFLRRMAETGLVEDEVRFKKKDGTVIDCQRTVVARKDEHGNTVAHHGVIHDITNRKRAQRALTDSEERFHSLFEQSMDAIHITAFDGSSVEVNQAWLDLFGYSRDEMSRLKAVDFYANPDDREDFLRRIAESGFFEDEVRFKQKDGTVLDCQLTTVARKDEHGNTVAYQGVIHDITNRKRAQRALQDSEEKFRSLFEQSMDAVAVVAVDGTLLDANPAYLRLYGFDGGEIGHSNVRDRYVREADRDEFLRRMEQHGAIRDEEVRLKKVDGTIMDCLLTSNAVRDAGGRVVSFQTVIRDVTEQKKAEGVLRESEAKFRELSELLPQAVCETDVRGNITFVNRRALDLWGYGEEGAETGLNFCELIAPEDLDRARADFESPQTWEGDVAGEFMALRKDGTVFPVQVYRSPIARGGEVVGVRIVLIDISDRKKTEQQLHNLAAHIEEVREDERTGIARELHDQLAQALTAMKLDLAGMKGRAERGEAIPPGKLAGMMGLIDETAADVRRISSELRPGLLDDLGLVAAMEWQLGQFEERTGLKCRLDSRVDDSGLGRSRTTALFRIFQEVLTNIGRHAGAAGVRVSFELDDGHYILMVADDGRGITEEEMTAPGSLGLIGMRERVRPLGGRIEIEGVPNGGTTVRVYVPAG